jgi:hypothetical protein
MPDLVRHAECFEIKCFEITGIRLEFIPMKIGAGMTILFEAAIYRHTPN